MIDLLIKDAVVIRDDVLRGRIYGWIRLRGIFKGGDESDPDFIFRITYPTSEIKNLLKAISEKLNGEREAGFFEIMGGYGTGKSHNFCLSFLTY